VLKAMGNRVAEKRLDQGTYFQVITLEVDEWHTEGKEEWMSCWWSRPDGNWEGEKVLQFTEVWELPIPCQFPGTAKYHQSYQSTRSHAYW
jgi:hypothetical protein